MIESLRLSFKFRVLSTVENGASAVVAFAIVATIANATTADAPFSTVDKTLNLKLSLRLSINSHELPILI